MKRIFTMFVAILLTANVFTQSPERMSYQAVVRNASNALVTSHAVGMQISILQGSASGTSVYTETQNPTTNANGLVNIEIGGGIVLSGNFATINWANSSYFIKTETDPRGGTNYTITGTSQLLSVPYALYAKTSGNGFSGNYNDLSNRPNLFNGEYSSLTGIPTLAPIATSGSYNDLANKPNIDGSETKLTAGTNITIAGTGTIASPYVINSISTHYVGELYGGGVVFWIDNTGQHGLICSMVDLRISQAWSDVASTIIGTTNDWDGASNTTAIIGQNGHTSSAAKLCDDYTNADYGTGTYSDWYLPGIAELNHVWNNLYQVQKSLTNDGNAATTPFVKSYYWSSSENLNNTAWTFFLSLGHVFSSYKDLTYYVRAVRAF
jgi:hypothetical protein